LNYNLDIFFNKYIFNMDCLDEILEDPNIITLEQMDQLLKVFKLEASNDPETAHMIEDKLQQKYIRHIAMRDYDTYEKEQIEEKNREKNKPKTTTPVAKPSTPNVKPSNPTPVAKQPTPIAKPQAPIVGGKQQAPAPTPSAKPKSALRPPGPSAVVVPKPETSETPPVEFATVRDAKPKSVPDGPERLIIKADAPQVRVKLDGSPQLMIDVGIKLLALRQLKFPRNYGN
jgi:hypothetical protein